MVRRPLALLAALLLAFLPAAAKAPPPRVAHPALWKLADKDTTIWLFGSIHVLPAGYKWRDPTIDRAIAGSGSLTLETLIDDPQRIGRALFALGSAKGLPPVIERVPPARRAALAKLIAASGVPQATLDGLKTWAAAIILTGPAMAQIGLAPGATGPDAGGVESQLTGIFRAAGKPIDGLETPEQQLGCFDALPESAQRAFLAETVDSPAKARKDFDEMLRAWGRGDVKAIERAFAEDPEFTPALHALLVTRRDANWTGELIRRLASPGTVFVAVGAGHLAGRDSVQAMLAAKGYKVVRVQ